MSRAIFKSTTTMDTWKGIFQWEIQRAAVIEFTHNRLDRLTSQEFVAGRGTRAESTWKIYMKHEKLLPQDEDVDEPFWTERAEIFLELLGTANPPSSECPSSLNIQYKLRVGVSSADLPFMSTRSSSRHSVSVGGRGLGLDGFPLHHLKDTDNDHPTHDLGYLVVFVDLSIFPEPHSTDFKQVAKSEEDELVDSLANLLASQQFSDVTITCPPEGAKFPAHKNILAARSPLFAKMLHHTHVEEEMMEGTLAVPGVPAPAMKIALEFIYTGRAQVDSLDEVMLTSLLNFADQFGVGGLKAICFKSLVHSITDENAGRVAVTVSKFNADLMIKQIVKEYCQKRHDILNENSEYRELSTKYPEAFN